MAAPAADWSTNSNDALTISLVEPWEGSSKTVATFHPKFTYPVFGEEESIFGYQGLNINLRYNVSDMRPNVQIMYDKKFKAIGDTEATDIAANLEPFLPKAAFDKTNLFNININGDIYKDWQPVGERIHTRNSGGSIYEVWKGNLHDRTVQQMMKRIMILVPLFIEAGTLLDLTEPEWSIQRWSVFFLYKKKETAPKKGSPYVFMGFSTAYSYYPFVKDSPAFTSTLPLDLSSDSKSALPCRSRISQFLILPTFQNGGNGSKFYEDIFTHYLEDPQTIEITVEDPNEDFDDLRDINDLIRIRTYPEISSITIKKGVALNRKGKLNADSILDVKSLEPFRRKLKIAPRQFIRLIEMQLLSRIDKGVRRAHTDPVQEKHPAEEEMRLWELFTKQRLYRHNKEQLIQLDIKERIDKLDDALEAVEVHYERLLETVVKRSAKPASSSNGKRIALDDGDGGETPSKRARVEDEDEE